MDYKEARAILGRLPSLEVKPGLERILCLLDLLGHPERSFASIHVGGTNGKGSVTAMLASILSRTGARVGRYTSPELVDFRDRIVVDGRWISEDEFALAVGRLVPVLDTASDPPTLFEALTAIAFDHFARNGVEIAVVEVGLGGRFDATNVVRPLLSLLTNVGLDHLAVLGSTLERIAWEKAGIAKPGIPLLAGDLAPEAERVVLEECAAVGTSLVHPDAVDVERVSFDWERATYRVTGENLPILVSLPLLGSVQEENLRLVLGAVGLLRAAGLRIDRDAVALGLREVSWPGRFEVVRRRPTIVLDGAHNRPAAEALRLDVERYVPDRSHRHLLLGLLADKEIEAMCEILVPHFAAVTVTRSRSPRALAVERLAEVAARFHSVVGRSQRVEEGLAASSLPLRPSDVLFVTGSLTVVQEARALLVEPACQR
jgi:dihydrofolate synthase/folylpolyglutamate synthase